MTKIAVIVFAALAAAFLAARPSPSPPPMPSDARSLAARVAAHPTDWAAASALTEKALDMPVRDRFALWHAANGIAASMAPSLPEPRVTFARSGFFHWLELSAADRKKVLDAYAPQLRDPVSFSRMNHEVFALTGDLDYLRRVRPPGIDAAGSLAWLAATYGRFDDYRSIRAEIEARGEAQPPTPPAGVERERWIGLCGENICASAWREISAARSVTIALKTIETDEVVPYVEVYVDGVRRAEGELQRERTFVAEVDTPGLHQVEVRLANRLTRNNVPRRIRVMSVRAV